MNGRRPVGFIRGEETKEKVKREYVVGEPLMVQIQGGGTAMGSFHGLNGQVMYLKPSIVYEPVYDSNGKERPFYRFLLK